MNRKILALWFLVLSLKLFGQEKSSISILETESTWNQEVFHFPIPFAPEIKFEGLEDARFPEFWANKDNIDFWSYVFVWSINNPVKINSSFLENNIEMYFNGLMNYKNSKVLFLKSETSKISQHMLEK
ncbi:hypothetical protein H9X57_04460 [Flavobacterium piscinae]|uniref:hypothetical protein n=1 Tax=Flavobacterium piscinae TaxID=2506424 RepID=UPI001997C828|nr:hypothetical protein [Flavobacterium piscinae]MBC8882897.1 hypothetical protein [Flavobacterium piscinae]